MEVAVRNGDLRFVRAMDVILDHPTQCRRCRTPLVLVHDENGRVATMFDPLCVDNGRHGDEIRRDERGRMIGLLYGQTHRCHVEPDYMEQHT